MFYPKRTLGVLSRVFRFFIPVSALFLALAFLTDKLTGSRDLPIPLPISRSWLAISIEMLPVVVMFVVVFRLGAMFVRKVYGVSSQSEAVSFLVHSWFGLPRFAPWIRISEGKITANDQVTLMSIGGPGNLVIYHDSAVLLEQAGRLTRVKGPGFPKLERFEKVYGVVELRPKRWSRAVKAVTMEGIPVTWDVEAHYKIVDGGQSASALLPYPADLAAVFAAITHRWKQEPARSGSQGMGGDDPEISRMIEGVLHIIMGHYSLDQLFEAERQRELREELEHTLQVQIGRIGLTLLGLKLGGFKLDAEIQEWVNEQQIEQIRQVKDKGAIRRWEMQDAQDEMVAAIGQALERVVNAPRAISSRLILKQAADVFEQAASRAEVKSALRPDAPRRLDSLMTIASWDSALHDMLRLRGSIGAADMPEVPPSVWPDVARRYVDRHQYELPLILGGGVLRLHRGAAWVGRWGQATQAMQETLARTGTTHDLDALTTLAEVLAEAVGMQLGGEWHTAGGMRGILVTRHALRLGVPPQFPLVFIPSNSITSQVAEQLIGLTVLMGQIRFFAIVVPLAPGRLLAEATEQLRENLRDPSQAQEFVVVSDDDIFGVLTAPHPAEYMTRSIVSQVSPASVSPFVIRNAVSGPMFFGRDWEIRTITQGVRSKNFAITGNRRIGKTSLLRQSQIILGSEPGLFAQFLDLQAVPDCRRLFRYLAATFSVSFVDDDPASFRAFVAALDERAAGKRIVLLIDEVDGILSTDRAGGYALSAVWRELSQTDRCHFVLAGHRVLARAMDDVTAPYFNFVEPVRLGMLERARAESLLTVPLEEMGIDLVERPALLNQVWDISAGHPSIIQYLGSGLLKKLGRAERHITPGHLDAVTHDDAFQVEYVQTMWGGADLSAESGLAPLERAILLLMPPDKSTAAELEQTLLARGFRVSKQSVRGALLMLESFGFVTEQAGTLSCAAPSFVRFIHQTHPVDDLLDQLKASVNGGQEGA